jgi:hypothetical protein
MATIRQIEIEHFRGIRALRWNPAPGVNCLIGAGDSCKSTVLDAIDLCLGARRNVQFTDADFHNLDVNRPLLIALTLGDLDDHLKSLDVYADFLRGFRAADGVLEDEPGVGLETVLTLRLVVGSDLEPTWSLYSIRSAASGLERSLPWNERQTLAPSRIGAASAAHLSWQRGSVLNRVSDERADASAALVAAARQARATFGREADATLAGALRSVQETARDLGVDIGPRVHAELDVHAASFNGGAIALHSDAGVPLRGLGTGSTRLLVAGLERRAAGARRVIIADEVEYGLEPHRLIRFLDSLGAKDTAPQFQAFLTTHAPVAVQELDGSQLFVLREGDEGHVVHRVGTDNLIQGTIRCFPEALLAKAVIACEGASELGFVRGVARYLSSLGRYPVGAPPLGATGVSLFDAGGRTPDSIYERASVFQRLGYRTLVFRDDDVPPTPAVHENFVRAGGTVVTWTAGRALEQELFASLPVASCRTLVDYAVELHGDQRVNDHIGSASQGRCTLAAVIAELETGVMSAETRAILGNASKSRNKGWFKSITWMEHVGYTIIGPALADSDAGFRDSVNVLLQWIYRA